MTRDSTCTSPSTDKGSAAYLKRREQVRRAQRTHRERKETYIHALEAEVVALRTKTRSVEEQNDALSLEVVQLRSELNTRQEPIDCAAWDTAWPWDDVEGGARSTGAGVEEEWLSTTSDVSLRDPQDPGRIGGVLPDDSCSALVRRNSGSKSWSASASHADMAMEFVLTLEKPCIQHAQSVVFEPLNSYPSVQSSVSNELATYHAFVEDQLVTSQSCTSDDVASSLDNLLSLSSKFCLENEVTPIQAWQHLRRYLEYGMVDTNGLRALMEALLEHVRCYGFGAVISQSVLDAACNRVFTIGI